MLEETRIQEVRQDSQCCDPLFPWYFPGIGPASHFAISMTNSMCRVGAVAATSVAELPQRIACGTLTNRRFGSGVQDGSDVQRPNRGFAGHRGLQLAWQHHTSIRHVVPCRAMT